MLNLMPANVSRRSGLSRRDILRLGTAASCGAMLPHVLTAGSTKGPSHPATAKNCIYIFLCGGPSQLELWDPKPDAPARIRGPFGTVTTKVPGVHFGGLIPSVAKQADKLSIIRSMSIGTTSHDVGIMRTLLANKIGAARNKPYPAEPHDHPALGAMLHHLKGRRGTMPPWAVIPRFFTTGSRFYKGQSAGFLGSGYEPFCLNAEKKGSLQRREFRLQNTASSGDRKSAQRLFSRKQLLDAFESSNAGMSKGDAAVRRMNAQYDTAFEMLTSSKFQAAFDVTREKRSLRERYGMNEYGQSFLLARRLVQRNVRFVNVFWTFYGKDGCQFNLWDNHGSDKKVCGGASRGIDMLKHDYCCPSFDKAFSTLLDDLDDRGLLKETLVVAVGEFGRTPKMNKNQGRDHWGACYSAALAGGGIVGGRVHGASDSQAAYVKDSPVSPYDLHATILHAFGYGPETGIPDRTGRPIRISDGRAVPGLFG